ncbi:hypothetical protein GCM10011402_36110 [Paracoccus acridae]|uniref:Uncharacterized protein n=1 Tax=Paracoccus acridae TaxID=1795310 RepID=A0ABQ1VMQ1_9RHOB|nr:hypothetical protein GCM10011402_36110 [Paracoccus acridae]
MAIPWSAGGSRVLGFKGTGRHKYLQSCDEAASTVTADAAGRTARKAVRRKRWYDPQRFFDGCTMRVDLRP